MSERQARAQRKAQENGGDSGLVLPDRELLLPPGTTEPPQEAPQQPESTPIQLPAGIPAIIVLRVPGEQPGQEQIQIAELNGSNQMDPLAIPTVLRLAAKIKEQNLGLDQ